MDYTVVYEVTVNGSFLKGPIVGALFLIIVIVWTMSTFHKKETLSGKLIMWVLSLLSIYMFCNTWYEYNDIQNNAVKPYLNGNYEVAEGVVENFQVTYEKGDEIEYEYKHFTVDGENFRIPNYGEGGVYCFFWEDYEISIEEGQQVKICYVRYNNDYNIIMKMEIAY